ncbi:cyclic nucleotide-binding domain-containing protein [Coralliovum pocilloporae]|uniref:cyclic nucleotide-binding domain-containing protein n=1 Tax=Coralliovum pocilloporae TaxID=3066369 RepID=UPI003307AEB7
MSLETDVGLLGRLPLFSEFNAEQLRLLAFSAENHTYSAGDILFWEGDPSEFGLVIVSGSVDLQRRRGEKTMVVGHAGIGDLIGELGLITDIERPATAVATMPTEVIRIQRPLFRRILTEYPDIAARIQIQLIERLSDTNAALDAIGAKLDY